MTYTDLPFINACLNATSTVLLLLGWIHIRADRESEANRNNIRSRHKVLHRNCMFGALCTSVVFLICYLYYHWQMQRTHGVAHTRFSDPAWFRPIYLTILFTHLVGAFALVPLVPLTVSRALRERYKAHAAIARWTLPVWLYVSVTGVVVYLLLYQVYPQSNGSLK